MVYSNLYIVNRKQRTNVLQPRLCMCKIYLRIMKRRSTTVGGKQPIFIGGVWE